MAFYKIAFLLVYACSVLSSEGPCIGDEFYKGCCYHTYWNSEIDECVRCFPGFYGLNCSIPCLFPFYGDICRSRCSCNSSLCDSRKGCIPTNETFNEDDVFAEQDDNKPRDIRYLMYFFISVSGFMLVVILTLHLALLIVQKQKKNCGGNSNNLNENNIYEIVIQDELQEQEM